MNKFIFGFIWVLYKFLFQIYWLGNRRKELCGRGRCSGFPCCSFWEFMNHWLVY